MSFRGDSCCPTKMGIPNTIRSRHYRPANRLVATAIWLVSCCLVVLRPGPPPLPSLGATALSVWSMPSLPPSKSAEASIDRAKFLSSVSSVAVVVSSTLFVPQHARGETGDNNKSNNNNSRYIETNLPMTYGHDKNGNPKCRRIQVRKWTGDATPFEFPVKPYEFTKGWPKEWPFRETDFFRSDSNDDGWVYKVPHLVYHIDEPAVASLTQYYRKNIPPRSDLLDICSSWVSHYPLEFPTTMKSIKATGMSGMELGFNDQLTGGYETKDLNEDQKLPYPDNSFDAVTCVVSTEYLVEPVEVLREVHRVLRPGGKVVVSQSNRCFPSKTIAMWLGMNDRQHLELINGYFQYAGGFEPRKAFDITARLPNNERSDPIYVIEAVKSKNSNQGGSVA